MRDSSASTIMATSTWGIKGLNSSQEMLVAVNSGIFNCSGLENALSPVDGSEAKLLPDLLACSDGDDGLRVSPLVASFSIEFKEAIRVKVEATGRASVTIAEAGRLSDFPFSRDITFRQTSVGPESDDESAFSVGIHVQNQPGSELVLNIGGIRERFSPLPTTDSEGTLWFIVNNPREEPESTFKFLYADSNVSFSASYNISSICLSNIGGSVVVGGRQPAAVPTDVWRVESGGLGGLVISNWQVAVGFQKASSISTSKENCSIESTSSVSDRRRTWLDMRPGIQGAVGFSITGLIFTPLINWIIPRGKRETKSDQTEPEQVESQTPPSM